MSVICYVAVVGNKPGDRIGAVKFGESGYYAVRGWDYPENTMEQVKDAVRRLNERLGISADVAEAMFIGSMFGWNCAGAELARKFAAEKG